jgi:sugar transferase (PEP-CTERM/EpsH1 system associated)
MTDSTRLRILIVTPSLPYPLVWGFGIRVYQIVRYLAQRHDVTLLAYAGREDQDSLAAVRDTGATVRVVIRDEPPTVDKRKAQLGSLLSTASFQRQSLRSSAMQAAIDNLLASESFDVIQVESSQMTGFHFRSQSPLLVDEHNIEYELLYRAYKTERSPLRKIYNWVEYRKFRQEEQLSWKQSDGCILTSDREEAILRRHSPATRTAVVPNGVDIDSFQPLPIDPDPDNVVFLGVMHYRPNVDAAMYFAREILPHVLSERPNLMFTIVGGGAPDELRRLASRNLVLTDTVPDARPYVARAGAFVVPLRMGSGTRLKVLEGLAMGRPVVSTSLGCEGLATVDGEHVMVADDPLAFARAVLHVLDDRALAMRLGQQGRRLVEQRYDWAAVLRQLELFMQDSRRKVGTSQAQSARAAHERRSPVPPLANSR